jgi:serine/threonine protein kinase
VNPEGGEVCVKCNTPLPRVKIASAHKIPNDAAIQFKQGELLANRYSVMQLVGRGGMGCIYRVKDNTLNEEVALKTLLPQYIRDKIVLERFFNEARIARRLAHPNIVRVHDIGSTGNVVYISMELLKGQSLRGLLEKLPAGQRLALPQVFRIFDELCSALEYAHKFTIHRDIKPENIMIGPDGAVKLMDFGISKLKSNIQLTGASIVMGTPFYMSPEQLRNSRDVDARADVFSVGVMLYEILTGSLPTGIPKPASQIAQGLPPALDAVVLRCVEPDREQRYGSAAELRAVLQELRSTMIKGGPMPSGPPKTQAPQGQRPKRKLLGGLLAAAILLTMAGALFLLESNRSEAPRSPMNIEVNAQVSSLDQLSFGELAELVDATMSTARDRAGTNYTLKNACDLGDQFWRDARSTNDKALARQALQCFLATCLRTGTEGMIFVPPGRASLNGDSIWVDGFFIDETEVTIQDFADFDTRHQWRFMGALANEPQPQFPMHSVTYYDAQAFAASQYKLLPTEAQWVRAAMGDRAYFDMDMDSAPEEDVVEIQAVDSTSWDRSFFDCRDMAGSVSEWTRTPMNPLTENQWTPESLLFATSFVTRGGNYEHKPPRIEQRDHILFNNFDPKLGFRCVRELPAHPQKIRQLISRNL